MAVKKLSTNEWVAVVVTLIIVGAFLVFPQVMKTFKQVMGTDVPPAAAPTPVTLSN